MIDKLIDKLLDLVIAFFRNRQNRDKLVFNNLVAPAFSALEDIHTYYISQFHKYRDRLTNKDVAIEELIDQIEADCRFSEQHRIKLRELSGEAIQQYPEYKELFEAIYWYLTAVVDVDEMRSVPFFYQTGQRWFTGLISALKALLLAAHGKPLAANTSNLIRETVQEVLANEPEVRLATLRLIDGYTDNVQAFYANVSRHYAEAVVRHSADKKPA